MCFHVSLGECISHTNSLITISIIATATAIPSSTIIPISSTRN